MEIGKGLIIMGFSLMFMGIVVYAFGDKIGFLGNLFGDLKYESKGIKIFSPITSMIIISIISSIIINLIIKIFK